MESSTIKGLATRLCFWTRRHACATFRHCFPGVPLVEKDVSELSVQADDLAPVQILAAGFPCQSFSQAGGRLGFEDPRGALFFEIPRLIEEYEPDERPSLDTSGQTIVKPTALGPVANTDTKLLIYGLFQKGRVLAQDGGVHVLAGASSNP